MPPLDHNERFILNRFAEGWKITGQAWRRGSMIEAVILHDMPRVESLAQKGMITISSDPDCKPVCYEITTAGTAVLRA